MGWDNIRYATLYEKSMSSGGANLGLDLGLSSAAADMDKARWLSIIALNEAFP